jgi:hypothetical protein
MTLDRGGWSASHYSCFNPGERAHGTFWTGSGMDPTASVDMVVKREITAGDQIPAMMIIKTIF